MQNQQVLSIWEKSGRMCVPERYLETIIINESNILRWHNIDFCCTAINLQFISIDKFELRGQEFDSGSWMFSSPVARPSSQEYHISKQSPLISECVKISVVRGCRVPDLDTWHVRHVWRVFMWQLARATATILSPDPPHHTNTIS